MEGKTSIVSWLYDDKIFHFRTSSRGKTIFYFIGFILSKYAVSMIAGSIDYFILAASMKRSKPEYWSEKLSEASQLY